jgi:hypothetical protein
MSKIKIRTDSGWLDIPHENELTHKSCIAITDGEDRTLKKAWMLGDNRYICGSTLCGIIWLKEPTKLQAEAMRPVIKKGGFEIYAYE